MRVAAGLRAALAMVVLAASPVLAQGSAIGPPGPYVIDVRGAMATLPQKQTFYPDFPAGTVVPARGFGIDAGAHVYPFRLGPARVGIGASILYARGTSTAVPTAAPATTSPTTTPTTSDTFQSVTTTGRFISPQLSLNFGDANGWSYLSGGYDTGTITATSGSISDHSGTLTGWNAGGGARWFLNRRLAFGFDLRLHRYGAASVFGLSAGISLR